MIDYISRQSSVRKSWPANVSAMLVTSLPNVRYLCGYTGSAGILLLLKSRAIFFTDFRYEEQAAVEIGKSAKLVVYKNITSIDAIMNYLKKAAPKSLAIEDSTNVSFYKAVHSKFPNPLRVVTGIVEKIRRIKDADELKMLKDAFAIADRAFAQLIDYIKPGRTETDIAAQLEFNMRKEGSEGVSFPTIVASGERSSCPHAQPTARRVQSGEMLKIDFGATKHGYHSDMTRTLHIGSATPKFREIYAIVLEAQGKALAEVKPGVACSFIDSTARNFIRSHGYGENFGHGLGHSLGLEIHESPSYSGKSKDTLQNGMVLTIEPGIYIPGWGGIRIEDVYITDNDRPIKLTQTSSKILEIF